MRRVIRPLPTQSAEALPDQCMLVDGHADYIDDGSTPAPADAVYVATEAEVLVNTLAPGTFRHTFAGWDAP